MSAAHADTLHRSPQPRPDTRTASAMLRAWQDGGRDNTALARIEALFGARTNSTGRDAR